MAKSTQRCRKSSVALATPVRRKAYWGVFNQNLKRVALFPYHQRQRAQQYAEQLSRTHNMSFFVRPLMVVEEETS